MTKVRKQRLPPNAPAIAALPSSMFSAGPPRNESEAKHGIVAAIKEVARKLGNRPSTCRKYYVHPAVLDAYADAALFAVISEGRAQHEAYGGLGLRPEEYAVMVIVAEYQAKLAKSAAKAA